MAVFPVKSTNIPPFLLLYIAQQLIRPYGTPPEDPETVDGSLFRITLSHSDGSTKIYEQKADRYLKAHGKNWQCISSQKALELSILLGQLESDGMHEAANAM